MTMIVGGASLALVEANGRSMHCEAYPSRLAMVLAVLDNGALGGGCGYGCDEHKAALDAVEHQLAETRAKITEMWERDAIIMAEPTKPPCLQCGAMTAEESEAKCHGSGDDCHGCRLWPEG